MCPREFNTRNSRVSFFPCSFFPLILQRKPFSSLINYISATVQITVLQKGRFMCKIQCKKWILFLKSHEDTAGLAMQRCKSGLLRAGRTSSKCAFILEQHWSISNPYAGFLTAVGCWCISFQAFQRTYCIMIKIKQCCYLLCVESGWLNSDLLLMTVEFSLNY